MVPLPLSGQRTPPRANRLRAGRGLGGWAAALLVLLACAIGLLIGAVIGLGNLLLVAPFLAVGGAAVLLVMPLGWGVWLLVLLSFLIVGPLIYFGQIDSARWLPPALGLGLMFPFVMRLLQRRDSEPLPALLPAQLMWYLVFLASLLLSSLLSSPRFVEVVFSSRQYYAYLPLAFIVLAGFVLPAQQERIWRFLVWCSIAQVPVVLYQALVVAPGRANQRAVSDAVVGTFPGNPEGGGAGAAMAVFMLMAALVAISLWRSGKLRFWAALAASLSCVLVVAMSEVKAIVLLIPVAIGLLYAKELLRRPGQTFVWIVSALLAMAALFVVYDRLYYQSDRSTWSTDGRPRSAFSAIENQFNPQLETRGAIIGRMAALADWQRRTAHLSTLPQWVAGYGAASTQHGRLGIGEVAERVPYRADITASTLLLWEAGVIGHLLVVLSFGTAAWAAHRLVPEAVIPETHRAILQAVSVSVVLYLLMLPYKDFMFKTPPSQMLLFFMFGYIGYWQRVVLRQRKACAPAVRRK